MTTLFNFDGNHNRLHRDWCNDEPKIAGELRTVRSPSYYAKRHAAAHGAAGMWRADGSLVLFYRDGASVKQHTFAEASPLKVAA